VVVLAGRSPLRLATLWLPTHREVVAAHPAETHYEVALRAPVRVSRVSAFHAAARTDALNAQFTLHKTPTD
jgi:hypothetical protein